MDHFARFGAVVAAAEKVAVMDSSNHEVSPLLRRAREVPMPVQLEMSSSKLGSIEEFLLINIHNQFLALICKINNVAKKFIPTSKLENRLSFIIKHNEGEPYSCFLFVSFLK